MTDSEQVRLAGYFPGAIGKVVELHGAYYARFWGLDLSFEAQVGRELSEFMAAFDPKRDGFWVAMVGDRFAGAIVIDGHSTPEQGARLRWFIVDPDFHGRGVGKLLMEAAMAFCKKAGHRTVYLWTFRGLDAARRLYERCGFTLAEEHGVDKWGGAIPEQKFTLEIAV